MRLASLLLLFAAACQSNISTPFPPGLEPIEDNALSPDGSYAETLRTSAKNTDYIHAYARGYVQVSPALLWQAVADPDADVAKCSTTQQQVAVDNDPTYEHSFLIHYTVNSVVTVQWDDQWRFGVVEGTDAAPTLGMIKHQKTQGSDFIHLSEGTIQVLATGDPNVGELSFVEHLDSVGAGPSDVIKNLQHNYDAIVAVAHGQPIPACP